MRPSHFSSASVWTAARRPHGTTQRRPLRFFPTATGLHSTLPGCDSATHVALFTSEGNEEASNLLFVGIMFTDFSVKLLVTIPIVPESNLIYTSCAVTTPLVVTIQFIGILMVKCKSYSISFKFQLIVDYHSHLHLSHLGCL